ncbi:MAG TPA: lycopene cyclase domain-containing protein [Longimicrobiales bacterium]|nr:lycopene cyclase domain-containing protein [Longimicrobiales bacterium]
MTYLAFHVVFILPPLLALAWLNRDHRRIYPRAWVHLWLIAGIALVYTTPWDNYLVATGVWRYGPDRVLATIGYVPVEEYLFFLLQPFLAGLWLYWVLSRGRTGGRGEAPPFSPMAIRAAGAVGYGLLAVAGALLLGTRSGTYLGLILFWAAPVLAGQWAYAGDGIWRRRRAWLLGVAVPTAYLWLADALALTAGIWSISTEYTLGPALGPLPLEEAVFFLATNLLVVQGLLLFRYPRGAA